MGQAMMRLINPFMKRLLRSPLHALVSRSYLLITLTGRRSGRQYTTPVQYGQKGRTVLVVTSKKYTWWKNLRGGACVSVRLRGRDHGGSAQVDESAEAVTAAFRFIYPRVKPERLEPYVAGGVVISITLDDART